MKLYNTPNQMRIELTKEEYLNICADHNDRYSHIPTMCYDLIEIECSDIDTLTITEHMLDECDDGFYMFSETFWHLFRKYTDYPFMHDEEVVEVEI